MNIIAVDILDTLNNSSSHLQKNLWAFEVTNEDAECISQIKTYLNSPQWLT
jgi:hypothetical protein